MERLVDIAPKAKARVIDLVQAAGIDTSDWKNYAGGERKAAANPKYCYEWGFIQPHKVAVLNLWHEDMKQRENGQIVSEINAREWGRRQGDPRHAIWQARANSLDQIIRSAYEDELPVRAIICSGEIRDRVATNSEASKVSKRALDPLDWAVTRYDIASGNCTIVRGASPMRFADQFTDSASENQLPATGQVTSEVFKRDPVIRQRVRQRAKGQCELCHEPGFLTISGLIYIETHHVIPLSEGGPDRENNVVALCPNHHREAHYGFDKADIRLRLLRYLQVQ